MTVRKYLKNIGGFTLVELLIVIAILAIIALIVIAAINPIEQANRARDTGMKADGSQLVSATDRYFTARFEFPWVSQDSGVYDNDDVFPFVSAGDYHIGLCAIDGVGPNDLCATTGDAGDGVLITTEELKPEFRNRNFIDEHVAGDIQDLLIVGKDAGSSSSVYSCYIPMSRANRQRACADLLVYQLNNPSAGERNQVDQVTCDAIADDVWIGADIATSYYVCVPE